MTHERNWLAELARYGGSILRGKHSMSQATARIIVECHERRRAELARGELHGTLILDPKLRDWIEHDPRRSKFQT